MPHTIQSEVVRFPPPGGGGEVRSLLSVIRRLSSAASLDEIMEIVTHGVRTLLQADGATFVLRDEDRCHYAEEDAISPLWKGRRFPLSACISGWCMLHRQAVAIPDIYQDSRIPADAYRPTFVRSLAMAPVGREEPVAALGAYWSEIRQIRPVELETLQAIANSAALAVANIQLQQGGSSRHRPAPAAPSLEVRQPERTADPAERSSLRGRWSLKALAGRLRREGLRPNSPEAYGFAVLCVGVATLARGAVGEIGVRGLLPFATYYPAVLLAILVGGARSGMLAAALGGLLAYLAFVPHQLAFSPFVASNSLNLVLYFAATGLMIWMLDRYRRAVLRLRHEDARHLTLAREQHHRVQNAVAVVEAIVRQSLRGDPAEARAINQRVQAGLASVDIRDRSGEQPTNLRALLTAELQMFDLARFTLEGEDDALLASEFRSLVSLAAHELVTNAVKYGALSVPEGRVTIAWRKTGGRTTIAWAEAGGPLVRRPQTRGYGSVLLRRLLEACGGSLTMEFALTGVTADISLPVEARRRR